MDTTSGPAVSTSDVGATNARPQTPRTPKGRLRHDAQHVAAIAGAGGALRHTPRRSPRIRTKMLRNAGLSPRLDMSDDDALMMAFGDAYPAILDNIQDLVSADPMLIEGIMNIGDTDFATYGGAGAGAVSSGRDEGPANAGSLFSNLSPELPKMQDSLSHHTFTGCSPTPVHRLLSPTIDLTRTRRRTGFTPSRAGQPSPRLAPFPTPSPYRLRSSPRTGFTPNRFGSALETFQGEFMFQPAQPAPVKTAKRPLLSDVTFGGMGAADPTLVVRKRSPIREAVTASAVLKQKRPKKEKAIKKKTTTSAPKRGEYRCGKCGFFPKKTKHNCTVEKAKREKEEAANAAKQQHHQQQQHAQQHAQQPLSVIPSASSAPVTVALAQDLAPLSFIAQ